MNTLLKVITIQTSPKNFTVCGYLSNGTSITGSYRTELAHRPADAVKSFIQDKGIKCTLVHANGMARIQVFVNLDGDWKKVIK